MPRHGEFVLPTTRYSWNNKKRHSGKRRRYFVHILVASSFLFSILYISGYLPDLSASQRRQKDAEHASLVSQQKAEQAEPLTSRSKPPRPRAAAKTLIIYVFSNSDPEYQANLLFFIREGIHAHDGCQYYIAIQEGPGIQPLRNLPVLPANARYLPHKNECFDLGTVGWVLERHVKDISSYKFIVWLNGSQRGPFLPAYVKRRMHWTEALTDRITRKVKMVGATINCGAAYDVPPVPHVQSYLVAVDQVGLKVLLQDGKALKCWETMESTVIHGELGSSAAIFLAGYSIDSLMLRYEGVNWRSKEALDCNAALNPIQNNFNDGINVDPLEVMFIKVKDSMRGANWTHLQQALKFDEWAQHARGMTAADLQANAWMEGERPRLLAEVHQHGPQCFDAQFYVAATPSQLGFLLQTDDPNAAAWNHFITYGVYEGRPFRYTC